MLKYDFCIDTKVILSLFDAQAVSFHKKLEDVNGDPRVIVATSINSKMVGGNVAPRLVQIYLYEIYSYIII